MATVSFEFNSQFQYDAFHAIERHQCYSGGYGNGKSSIASMKGIALSSKFPRYRIAILRRSSIDLRRTTMETFFKWCPPGLYNPAKGGARVDSRNYLRLINGSEIFWLHLDDNDSNVVRGLEINTAIIDQAEEVGEEIYDHLNSRVGRWDMAELPEHANPDSYKKDKLGRPVIPSYMIICVNPDSFEHWVYKRYHEESEEHHRKQIIRVDNKEIIYKYSDDHKMYHGRSIDNPALGESNIRVMLQKDEAFVKRFVMGVWGIPEGAIHRVPEDCILEDIPVELLDKFLIHGSLTRILDHGYEDPTCCLWVAAYEKWHLCYREYYKGNEIISTHRTAISKMSSYAGFAENYRSNIADPSIFKKTSEKFGGRWSVADEYQNISGPLENVPAIHWEPADNNEFLTRNMIDEMLRPKDNIKHPITGKLGAPSIYFLKKSDAYPYGIDYLLRQLQAQKKKQIAVVNGKPIFSDERDDSIPDHAYDTLRYYVGTRPKNNKSTVNRVIPGSFDYAGDRVDRARVGKVAARGILPAGYFDV